MNAEEGERSVAARQEPVFTVLALCPDVSGKSTVKLFSGQMIAR